MAGIQAQLEPLHRLRDAAERPLPTTPTGSGRCPLLDFLRDVGKHFTVNEMIRKDSVGPAWSARSRGSRSPSSATCSSRPRTSCSCSTDYGCRLQMGGSDQWGNITMGVDLIRRGRETAGLRAHLAARDQGRRHQVRKDRGRGGVAGPGQDQPVPVLPVLHPHRRRRGRGLSALLHLSRPRRHPWPLDADTAEHPERRAAQHARPAGVRARPRAEGNRRAEAAALALYAGRAGFPRPTVAARGVRQTATTTRGRAALDGDGLALVPAGPSTPAGEVKGRGAPAGGQGGCTWSPPGERPDARLGGEDLSSADISRRAKGGTTIWCASRTGTADVLCPAGDAPDRAAVLAGAAVASSSDVPARRRANPFLKSAAGKEHRMTCPIDLGLRPPRPHSTRLGRRHHAPCQRPRPPAPARRDAVADVVARLSRVVRGVGGAR